MVNIERQEAERLTSWAGNCTKVPLVKCEDIQAAVALGEHHERSVCQAEAEVGVTLDDLSGGFDIRGAERRKFIRTECYILQHQELGPLASDLRDQVIELGKHEGREDAALRSGQDAHHCAMVEVTTVVIG